MGRRAFLCHQRTRASDRRYYLGVMPLHIHDLVSSIDAMAPFTSAADWDSVGLQIGDPRRILESTAVAHELTDSVVDAAIDRGVTLVVTYHPLVFRPLTSVTERPGPEGRVLALINAGVAVVAVHTNWDVAPGGTSDSLATALSLEDVAVFGTGGEERNHASNPMEPIGRIGTFEGSVDGLVKAATDLGGIVRTTPLEDASVRRVALLPGSGGSFVGAAADAGADVLITGDISHHDARHALDRGMAIIDAGHAATERPGVRALYAAVVDVVGSVTDLTEIDESPWEGG